MDSLTDAQQLLLRLTGALLHASFDELVLASEEEPAFFVRLGAIGVRVNVEPIGDDSAIVEAYAWIGQELAITPELGLFLVQRNVELRVGALCVDQEGSIFLQHALFAESVNEVVLERLVRILATNAERLDDELTDRFG
jgi:hypothetical protein